MKNRILAALICTVTMCVVGIATAWADDNSLKISNETPEKWTVIASFLVPPIMGSDNLPGLTGVTMSQIIFVDAGSNQSPARAAIEFKNGRPLTSLGVSTIQRRGCSINKIESLDNSFWLHISTSGLVLKNTLGEIGRCSF